MEKLKKLLDKMLEDSEEEFVDEAWVKEYFKKIKDILRRDK